MAQMVKNLPGAVTHLIPIKDPPVGSGKGQTPILAFLPKDPKGDRGGLGVVAVHGGPEKSWIHDHWGLTPLSSAWFKYSRNNAASVYFSRILIADDTPLYRRHKFPYGEDTGLQPLVVYTPISIFVLGSFVYEELNCMHN